ncbi:MAG: LPS-assembly protein LptD [Alphaproteobacteria bacterium]|nr:LPS-assembly protein LptD [Alphaproteobacteria bacterium]
MAVPNPARFRVMKIWKVMVVTTMLAVLPLARGYGASVMEDASLSHRKQGAAKPVQTQARGGAGTGTAEISQPAVLITADEMVHDQDLGTVTARGHVEIDYADRIVLADTVNYNTTLDVVTASGNVSILEPDGSVMFSSFAELTGDLKDAFVRDVRILLSDHSRLAGVSAKRTAGDRNEVTKGVYSPCNLCKEDPSQPPLWQIKAVRIIHDEPAQQIEYHDAKIEAMGVPVFYTPYLSHPDPTVTRRSGLLTPTWGASSTVGAFVRTPYFVDLGPSTDLTFTPTTTTNQGMVFGGGYGQRFTTGEVKLDGSVTRNNKDNVYSHIFGLSQFDLDDTWRTGLQVQRVSNDTYLQRYKFPVTDPYLTTHGTIEGFSSRSYAALEGYSFQSLHTADVPSTAPIVLPLATYDFVGEPASNGGFWNAAASSATVDQKHLAKSSRASVGGGWTLPHTTSDGSVLEFNAGVRSDGYYVEKSQRSDGSPYNGTISRIYPETSLMWRFPLTRSDESTRQVIEPIVQGVVSPRGGNSVKIPNLDSANLEFDDTNLFSHSRFTGYDRVETGPRVNYGINYNIFDSHPGGAGLTALLGESLRVNNDRLFAPGTGLDNHLSDYVGRVDFMPYGNLNFLYRFRLNQNDLSVRSNEISTGIGPKALHLDAGYIFIRQNVTEGTEFFGDREQGSLSLTSAMTQHWKVGLNTVVDMTSMGGPLSEGIAFTYEDECLIFMANIARYFTYSTYVQSGYSMLMNVVFKTLGEVPLQSNF